MKMIHGEPVVTTESLNLTVEAIKSFKESETLKEEELEEVARKALLLHRISDQEWLLSELLNFHENKKQEEEKEKAKQIKPTEPVKVENQEQLNEVLQKHSEWIEGVLGTGTLEAGLRANLTEANLAGMTLENCTLSCAKLDGASFIGSKLIKVNFSRATLIKTSFEGAHIEDCKFHKAELEETDFREADLVDTDFTDEQKQKALGLF